MMFFALKACRVLSPVAVQNHLIYKFTHCAVPGERGGAAGLGFVWGTSLL